MSRSKSEVALHLPQVSDKIEIEVRPAAALSERTVERVQLALLSLDGGETINTTFVRGGSVIGVSTPDAVVNTKALIQLLEKIAGVTVTSWRSHG